MPALLLIMRIGKVIVPLPYFIIWLILLPFVPLAWLVGLFGSVCSDRDVFKYLLAAPFVFWMLMCLHGTEVRVDSRREHILIKFI